jgi:CHAT domain-containing protein
MLDKQRLFLIEALQKVDDSSGDPRKVYPFLSDNLDLLDEGIVRILEDWVSSELVINDPIANKDIAGKVSNFGVLICQFSLGDIALNIELSISCFNIASEIFNVAQDTDNWIGSQRNLSNAYKRRLIGVRENNLDVSISRLESILSVFVKKNSPVKWAMIQCDLAELYSNRIKGIRFDNLQKSIECLKAAAEVYAKEISSLKFIRIHLSIASIYLEIGDGISAINHFLRSKEAMEAKLLSSSISYIDKELVIFMLGVSQEIWRKSNQITGSIEWGLLAFAENLADNLNIVFDDDIRESYFPVLMQIFMLISRSNDQNKTLHLFLKEKINFLNQNLIELINKWGTYEFESRKANKEKIFSLCHVLTIFGCFMQDFTHGDLGVNIEISIACFNLILDALASSQEASILAATQNNIACSYIRRVKGDQSENIEIAIAYCESALKNRNRKDWPVKWAATQNNLGNAYCKRIIDSSLENLELAIKHYELSLEIRTEKDFPLEWATTYNNLADAYADRLAGNKSENLECAISCYESVLKVRTKKETPIEWAVTNSHLGLAYDNRVKGDKVKNLKTSIKYHLLALKVHTRKSFPVHWATNKNNIGAVYVLIFNETKQSKYFKNAIKAYMSALEIRTPICLPIDCFQSAKNLGDIYSFQEDYLNAVTFYEIAIQSAEVSHSYSMGLEERQRIIKNTLNVFNSIIHSCVKLELYIKAIEYSEKARGRQLLDYMSNDKFYSNHNILLDTNQYVNIGKLLRSYEESQWQLQVEREKYNRNTGDYESKVAEEIIQSLESKKQESWKEIRRLDPALAIQKEIIPIDLATIQTLVPQAHQAILSIYTTDNDTHIFIIQNGKETQLHTCHNQGWQNLQEWLRTEWLEAYAQSTPEWRAKITSILIELAERLQLRELISKLVNITELIIIPHLYLHQIPFSALPVSDGYLGDKFTISYAPSCQILKMCADRQPTVKTKKYGTIENPDNSLPGASYECQAISELLNIPDQYRLQGSKQATITNFQELLKSANGITHIHNATHGQSRLDNPLESAIFLAEEKLTLDRLLISRYPHLQEIFLAACETHLGNGNLTDDILTLATGFMCAGASTVISTLWAVDDIATALFSIFYYQNCQDSQNPAQAIKNAQKQLRQLSGSALKNSYQSNMERHFTTYIERIEQERTSLKKQKENGSITTNEFNATWMKLTKHYNRGNQSSELLAMYCQQENPFAEEFYWAAFICHGLG